MALLFLLPFAPAAFSQQPLEADIPLDRLQEAQTAEDTNSRISLLAQTAGVREGDYLIGSGDVLGVEVFDVPELSRDLQVSESGLVSIPLVPVKVRAAGLTTFQLQDKISELLQVNGLVTNPQVTVTVKERHTEPITVIGAVRNPLVVQASRPMTLVEVLSQAGGIASDAGSKVLVTRARYGVPGSGGSPGGDPEGGATVEIDLAELLDSGDPEHNIVLRGGDVVSVPRAGIVYAVGAVQRAGGFVMQGDREQITVLKVLSLSGGLTGSAKPSDAVIIRQGAGANDEQQVVPVDLKRILALKSEDVPLRESDILFVPDSTGKRALRRTAEVALSLATGVAIIRAGR